MVRYEALLRYGRRFQAAEGCEPIVNALGARVDHQALLAIDLLGGPCRPGDHAFETLLDFAAGVGEGDWHRPAHAIVAAVKASPEPARRMLGRFLAAPDWHTRMYAARAAGELRDAAALGRLAADGNDNVREAAVSELSKVSGHEADPTYVSALGAADFQLVMTAAKALSGSPDRAAAVPALLASLSRLTGLARDTSRDPRVALLERIQELGTPEQADQLKPYLEDADPRVAGLTARILTTWTGHAVEAAPRPRPAPAFTLTDADLDRLSRSVVRFTMANGRQFEMRVPGGPGSGLVGPFRRAGRPGVLQRPDVPPRDPRLAHPGREPGRQRVPRARAATGGTKSGGRRRRAARSDFRPAAATPGTGSSTSTSWTRPATTTSTRSSAR